MSIDAILFDADGVIQKPSKERRRAWRDLLGSDRNLDKFLADIFEAEPPALEGQSNFIEALSDILSRWKCRGTLTDALAAWTMIEVDAEIAGTIRTLRRSGVRCYLATNQESHRACYMSSTLGYRDLFDEQFYSCRLGVMKPAVAYFYAILKELDVRPRNVLFLDDHLANIDSARETGLHATEFRLEAGPDQLMRSLGEFGILCNREHGFPLSGPRLTT